MNFAPPKWITEAAEQALNSVAPNHYSHPRGRIRLREAIKNFYDPLFNRSLNVDSEILITSGANEGMCSSLCRVEALSESYILAGMYSVLTAFLEQGDEVILFEPFFDQYLPSVTFNGGKPVYVPLHPPASHIKKPTSDDWTIDMDELRCVIVIPMNLLRVPHPNPMLLLLEGVLSLPAQKSSSSIHLTIPLAKYLRGKSYKALPISLKSLTFS